MLLTTLALLVALATPALAPAATPGSANPYDGFYACTTSGTHYVVWIGDGGREGTGWKTYEVVFEDRYPFGDEVRRVGGGGYHTRDGSFDSGTSSLYFEDGVPWLYDEPCTRVSTLREALVAFDLEPDDAVQEVIDLEGWARGQVEARLDDPAFALTAFHGTNPWPRVTNLGPPSVAQILVGATLPAPPPPLNAAPADLPQGSDAFAGIYVDGGSTPRIHLIRDGRYVQFSREYNSKRFLPYGYAYEFEDGYDYRVRRGAFNYQYADLEFEREGDRAVMLTYRGRDARRVYTLRQLIEENDFDAATMVTFLVDNGGLTEAEATALLDDAAAFDAAVREGPERFLFADLVGL